MGYNGVAKRVKSHRSSDPSPLYSVSVVTLQDDVEEQSSPLGAFKAEGVCFLSTRDDKGLG